MNKAGILVGSTLALLSTCGFAKDYVLTDTDTNTAVGNWRITNHNLSIPVPFSVEKVTLHGGKQEGTEVITIKSGDFILRLSPTRGMGILSVLVDDVRMMGWDSPVNEIINPKFINLDSRGGAGFLEGFNEAMVRCGYEWTGHPVVADGQIYSLHGRAENTPVSRLVVSVQEKAPYTITVKGLIKERTFKKSSLETWATLSYIPGHHSFTVSDTLTNVGDYPQDYQIIYHSNFGTPILEEGAHFVAPVKEISPFNDYAVAGLKTWQTYLGPTRNFDEMVFNVFPYSDAKGNTQVMVKNRNGDKGAGIAFNTNSLPFLSLWKNTDTLKRGYVTGLEPGTDFAYPVTIEREQNRVRKLAPGTSVNFNLTYTMLTDRNAVNAYEEQINAIQGDQKTRVVDKPMAHE